MNKNSDGKFSYSGVPGRVVRGLAVALAALAISGIASAQQNTGKYSFNFQTIAKFEGGIGVITVIGANADGQPNSTSSAALILAHPGGLQPWMPR